MLGGTNLYAYVGNDPVNFIDPLGLHRAYFDGLLLIVKDDYGNVVGNYRASSGRIGYMNPKYQKCRDLGPIPEGEYYFDPADIERPPLLDRIMGSDWGKYRVRLFPLGNTAERITSFNRTGGFYIHGGRVEGTAGCIDTGDRDVAFRDLLRDHGGLVPLYVDYSNWPDPKSW